MKYLIILVAALALVAPAFGRTFTRCSLAQELFRLGTPKSELAIWTCLAERESSYRTNVVGPPNSDGSRDYGVFQINGLYWCQPADGRFSYNECRLSCNSLLTDNISNSVMCSRKIKNQQGWAAWSTWQYCNSNLPSIDPCF